MKVKINGLMTQVDAIYANMAAPDMVGLVFEEGSPYRLSKASAINVCSMLGNITRVGLFSDPNDPLIAELIREDVVDAVQIDGLSAPGVTSGALGVDVFRAFHVDSKGDLEIASSCDAEYIILDVTDHSILEDVDFDYILSGGLTPGNVLSMIRKYSPIGVDVSEGVDTNGIKDPTKMTAFVYASGGDFEPIIEHH